MVDLLLPVFVSSRSDKHFSDECVEFLNRTALTSSLCEPINVVIHRAGARE